jgi:hypothetical protein
MDSIEPPPLGPQTAAGAPPETPSTFAFMRAARRWLIASPDKKPFYANGQARHGTLDSPEDIAQFATYDEARAALEKRGEGWLLGFALGPDGNGGHWQGVDLDDIPENGLVDLAYNAPGYVENSPSANGAHAIGYGRHFITLGPNGTGVEAYAGGRYFTVTEAWVRDSGLVCLADYVEQTLAPRHGARRPASAPSGSTVVEVDSKTVTELRSALNYMRSVDYHLWIRMGIALKELGQTGQGLWLDWSEYYDKFDRNEAYEKWDTFPSEPHSTGYQAVIAEAMRQGWVNPGSNAAQLGGTPATPSLTSARQLKGRSLQGVQMRAIDWLWTGWIPKGYVTIFAGETGAGKSTVLADVAARVTTGAPWPGPVGGQWREPGRVLWLGSEDGIEEMTVPRLMACGANLENVIEIQGVMQEGKHNTFSLQDDIEAVGNWLKFAQDEGKPIAMLVIDPVTSYLPGQKLRKVDMNDAGQLRAILEPWLKLAQEHRVAIVCVTHFGKDTSKAMIHRVLGSTAFAATCRSLCAVMDRPATEDYEPEPHEKVLMQVKVNLPEHPGGAWKFRTERVEVGIDPENGKPIHATRPQWDELDDALTPTNVIGRARGPKSQQELPFAIWMKAIFVMHPPGTWLDVNFVKYSAIRDTAAPSEGWWNKHSGDFLEKQNVNGTWMCRPKPPAPPRQ